MNLKSKIHLLRNEGKSYRQISKELGCSRSTISYHCKNTGLDTPIDIHTRKFISNVDPSIHAEIIEYYKTHSNDDVIKKYGITIYILNEITKGVEKNKISELTGYARVKEYRNRIKQRAIEYKGSKCYICGYSRCTQSLSFHHIDPGSKSFSISKSLNTKWDVIKNELDKCVLLCMNCHMEVHNGYHDTNPVMAKLVKAFG